MKKILLHVFIISTFVSTLSGFVFAQRDKTVSGLSQMYVISAKAGGINYLEGNVTVARSDGKSGNLVKGDNLEIGDRVMTGANGKTEILLNPGSFVRLGSNSEFEFVTTSLDDLILKLNRGSAIFEVFADKEYSVSINTPNVQFRALKSGIYRVDILNDGGAQIEVWDGRAQVGVLAKAVEVKQGRTATVINGETTIAKLDRNDKDELVNWSKDRAKEISKVNDRLERRSLRDSLIAGYNSNSWNMYNSFGLWVYDASFSGYCFFPFGYGWRSPYGFGYGWNVWTIRLPYYVYYQPINPVINNSGGNGNGNANNTSRRTPTKPPFESIQNDVGTSPMDARTPRQNPFPTSQPVPVIVLPQNPNGARTRGN